MACRSLNIQGLMVDDGCKFAVAALLLFGFSMPVTCRSLLDELWAQVSDWWIYADQRRKSMWAMWCSYGNSTGRRIKIREHPFAVSRLVSGNGEGSTMSAHAPGSTRCQEASRFATECLCPPGTVRPCRQASAPNSIRTLAEFMFLRLCEPGGGSFKK